MGFFDQMYLPAVDWQNGEQYPMFTRVSIETCSTCTRSCSFCPVIQRPHTLKLMDDLLYAKILQELGQLNFAGVVQWFYVNEPLMDRKHLERIKMLRTFCPKVTIHVTTNWETMRKKDFAAQVQHIYDLFDAGVNSLNLNAYELEYVEPYALLVNTAASLPKRNIELGEHCWQKIGPRKRRLSTTDMTNPPVLHSWSGFYKDATAKGHGRCARPHRHLVIDWEGNVPLCCATNPTGMEVISNVREHSLVEAWNSERMFYYRWNLQEGQRVDQCANCTERVAYPHVVRDVKPWVERNGSSTQSSSLKDDTTRSKND